MEGVAAAERDRLDVALDPKGSSSVAMTSRKQNRNAREIIDTPGLGVLHIAHAPEPDHERILRCAGIEGRRRARKRTRQGPAVDAGYRFIDMGWDYRLFEKHLPGTMSTVRSSLKD
jgi:hypothetical protein